MSSEVGHDAKRVFRGQDGDLHLNGANVWDPNEKALAQGVSFAPAAGAANVCNVTIQVKDGNGNNLARVHELCVMLSDANDGNGLTATAASGTVQSAGTGGTDLQAKVAKKALDVVTDNTGKYVLAITDTGKTGFYIAAFIPGTGVIAVSAQLVAGNYG
jgi:hypothetical protein